MVAAWSSIAATQWGIPSRQMSMFRRDPGIWLSDCIRPEGTEQISPRLRTRYLRKTDPNRIKASLKENNKRKHPLGLARNLAKNHPTKT